MKNSVTLRRLAGLETLPAASGMAKLKAKEPVGWEIACPSLETAQLAVFVTKSKDWQGHMQAQIL